MSTLILDTTITYDCLAVPNLARFELLVRRKQLIAEAHLHNPSAPNYEGSDCYLGSKYKRRGAVVVPALTDYVSKRLCANSVILKERRKPDMKGATKGRPPTGAPKWGQGAAAS